MKLTIVALGLMPALCVAAPSPHSGCHTTRYKTIYETIYGVECHTRYDTKCHVKYETDYRVGHLLADLGWVDLDLECSTIMLGQ